MDLVLQILYIVLEFIASFIYLRFLYSLLDAEDGIVIEHR